MSVWRARNLLMRYRDSRAVHTIRRPSAAIPPTDHVTVSILNIAQLVLLLTCRIPANLALLPSRPEKTDFKAGGTYDI